MIRSLLVLVVLFPVDLYAADQMTRGIDPAAPPAWRPKRVTYADVFERNRFQLAVAPASLLTQASLWHPDVAWELMETQSYSVDTTKKGWEKKFLAHQERVRFEIANQVRELIEEGGKPTHIGNVRIVLVRRGNVRSMKAECPIGRRIE